MVGGTGMHPIAPYEHAMEHGVVSTDWRFDRRQSQSGRVAGDRLVVLVIDQDERHLFHHPTLPPRRRRDRYRTQAVQRGSAAEPSPSHRETAPVAWLSLMVTSARPTAALVIVNAPRGSAVVWVLATP
jgi:hypothetical protein